MQKLFIVFAIATATLGSALFLGCSDAGDGGGTPTGGSDGGVDTPGDVQAVDANDFGNFQFNWYGTGVSSSFFLDRDCGVSATLTSSGTPPTSGTGVVAPTDCAAFEKLVTSPAVVSALSDKAPSCSAGTDDMGTWTLGLLSGGTISRTASGCSSVAPFANLRGEMSRLATTYAHPSDAGPDASAASDATDASGD